MHRLVKTCIALCAVFVASACGFTIGDECDVDKDYDDWLWDVQSAVVTYCDGQAFGEDWCDLVEEDLPHDGTVDPSLGIEANTFIRSKLFRSHMICGLGDGSIPLTCDADIDTLEEALEYYYTQSYPGAWGCFSDIPLCRPESNLLDTLHALQEQSEKICDDD